jgi:HlyD family secretion protein
VQQIRLNPTTQQNVVTYNVRVSLSNPEQILLPGMTAYVSIGVASRQDACWCPTRRCVSSRPTATATSRQRAPRWPAECASRSGGAGEARGKGKKRDTASGTVYRDRAGRAESRSPCSARDHRQPQHEVLGGDLKAGDIVVVGENVASSSGKPSSVGMRLF